MLKIQNVGAFPGGDAFLLDDGCGACLLETGFGFYAARWQSTR